MNKILKKKKSKLNFSIKDKFFAHLETWRLYTVMWCGLVSFVGSCIAFKGLPPIKIAFLTLLIPMMGWIAGLYLSDYLDRNLDSLQKPHRPIPSGRIKPNEALFMGAIFAIAGLFLSISLTTKHLFIIIIVALLVFTYAGITKSLGILGNLNRGLIIVTAYFFGVFSLNQSIHFIPLYIWLLSFVFFIHDTNSNIIGALRDIEGDKKGGFYTVPVKYGVRNSIFISSLLTFIWFPLAIIIPFHFKFLKTEFFIMIIFDFIIIILIYRYLFSSVINFTREKALKFHIYFVIERITLASAFIFGIVSIFIATIILLFSLILTIISQNLLRRRYEFAEVRK